jgi:hypothetical protein
LNLQNKNGMGSINIFVKLICIKSIKILLHKFIWIKENFLLLINNFLIKIKSCKKRKKKSIETLQVKTTLFR